MENTLELEAVCLGGKDNNISQTSSCSFIGSDPLFTLKKYLSRGFTLFKVNVGSLSSMKYLSNQISSSPSWYHCAQLSDDLRQMSAEDSRCSLSSGPTARGHTCAGTPAGRMCPRERLWRQPHPLLL